jgi:hypothetical protein
MFGNSLRPCWRRPHLTSEVENAEAALHCLQDRGREVAMIFADIRQPWRGLDVLVEADKAIREPQPPMA